MLPDPAVVINEEHARQALKEIRAQLALCNRRRKLHGSEPINMDYFIGLISVIDHVHEVEGNTGTGEK